MRTDQEILARIVDIDSDDWTGTMRGDLSMYLSLEAIRPLCKPDADLSDHEPVSQERDAILGVIREYMPFAVEKATGHRGISAGRSVDHFKSWVWLLGDYEEIDWNDYENYGAPILRQICQRYDIPVPDDVGFTMMAGGHKCSAHCDQGCAA